MATQTSPTTVQPRAPILDEPPPLPRRESALIRSTSLTWELVQFTLATLRALFTPPFSWGGEFIDQAWLLLKRAWFPVAVSAFVFGYGAPGLQGTAFGETFGDINRVASILGAATIREQAVWVTGMVVAGVIGTAICADLGARKVRDELNAMAVMGIDAMRRMVAPRVLAITLLMPALGVLVIFVEYYGIQLAYVAYGGQSGAFKTAAAYSYSAIDIFSFLIKTVVVGFIVGIVCCFKGMNVSGGSRGVGRAVNQAVVLSFALVWILNFAFNSTYLSLFPQSVALR
ncbi:MAG TPA: ABC transporter permease [Solirubrobacteraceae bacterium]|jgi:phospholipid/cholesterol/gamma-HCH transport system permease protein|nr:ABC transporter permease [Solirubrobacteraceae bacterium]